MAKKEIKEITELAGVGPVLAEKLREAGYGEMINIATGSVNELKELTGMAETVVRRLIKEAMDNLNMGFTDGVKEAKRMEKIFHIPLGSKQVDEMMKGGFESGSITECYGEFGSGKTQMSHQLAVNLHVQDPKAITVYIDTENTFKPDRIIEMAEAKELNPQKVLKNIKIVRAFNTDHQMLMAEKIFDMITEDKLPVKLIIIDSLMAHFRSEFPGRATLSERQQKINKHMGSLKKLATIYNIIVYVTNQVTIDPGMMFGDPTKPIGGHIVGHNSQYRLYLRKGKKGSRVAKLVDAPHLADAEAVFNITEGGIVD